MNLDYRAYAIAIAYCLVTVSANLLADILIPVAFFLFPLAVFIIPFTFTLRDYAHWYGRRFVYTLIAVAAVINVLVAWLTNVPFQIIVASFTAIVVSEATDTEIYQALLHRVSWLRRVLLSNAVSVPLDSLLFVTIAFGFRQDVVSLVRILGGQILVKYALSALSAYAHVVIPPLRDLRNVRVRV